MRAVPEHIRDARAYPRCQNVSAVPEHLAVQLACRDTLNGVGIRQHLKAFGVNNGSKMSVGGTIIEHVSG